MGTFFETQCIYRQTAWFESLDLESESWICFKNVEPCASSWNTTPSYACFIHWRCWGYDSAWWPQWSWYPAQPSLTIFSASHLCMFYCCLCSLSLFAGTAELIWVYQLPDTSGHVLGWLLLLSKWPLHVWGSGPHRIHGSLGPPKSTF